MPALALSLLFFLQSYGQLEMSFEANRGQTDPSVEFLARGNGYGLFLTPGEAVLKFARPAPAVVRMKLSGAKPDPQLEGVDRLSGTSHYFTGDTSLSGIPTYRKVRYRDVYPGVDVVYYGTPRFLEYDFELRSGADPGKIGLTFDGVDGASIDGAGDLILATGGNNLTQRKPFAYQVIDGAKKEIEAAYTLDGNRVGFRLGAYDRTKTLIIDPVLVYSTYMGGSAAGAMSDQGNAIAVDSGGNAYVTGFTSSADFPVANARQSTIGGEQDAFLLKLDPSGTVLLFSTFIGGSAADEGRSIALDAANNILLTGITSSSNFPTVNAVQPARVGNRDAFVMKLNNSGSSILYSTFLGGNEDDRGMGLAVDAAGAAYVTGATDSRNFPAVGAMQPAHGGGLGDVFVTKLNSGGGFVYSTFVGGIGNDQAYTVALDPGGNAYVAGLTTSSNFPLVNAPQTQLAGGADDAFIFKLDPSGRSLVYSTYIGGEGTDNAVRIAVDAEGSATITGITNSIFFPVTNAISPELLGSYDAFITRFNPDGRTLAFSTFFGGLGSESGSGIAQDRDGNIYVTGFTDSLELFVVNAIQLGNGGLRDAYVLKLTGDGQTILYSTYLGGTGAEGGVGMAVDAVGNAYVTGFTQSPNFPIAYAQRTDLAGGQDGFILKIDSRDIVSSAAFNLPRQGLSSFQTGGASRSPTFGYATAEAASPETRPAGLAILTSMQNGALVNEVGIASPALIQVGRIFVEVNGTERSVISLANTSDEEATVEFHFTNLAGEASKFGTTTIPARSHFSRFVSDDPLLLAVNDIGTWTFASSIPLAAAAFHTLTNERSEFIITSLPVLDLNVVHSGNLVIPHFAEGFGWASEVILVNPSEDPISGQIHFRAPDGQFLPVLMSDAADASELSAIYGYEIAPRSIQRFETGRGTEFLTGSIQIVPTQGPPAVGSALLSRMEDLITVTRTGVDVQVPRATTRLYAEAQGNFDEAEVNSIRTGIAVANLSGVPATVRLELLRTDGTFSGLVETITIPSNGQYARFLHQIPAFAILPAPFNGILRVVTMSQSGVAATAVRSRLNDRGNFIVATTGPVVENAGTGATLVFPHIADGGGYASQFIVLGGAGGSNGTLRFFDADGQPVNLTLR